MDNKATLPIYELYYYGLKNPTLSDAITYWLLKHNWKGIFDRLIYYLDNRKFGSKVSKYKKIIECVECDAPIIGGDGEKNNSFLVFRTVPYKTWKLYLEDGNMLECADEHILYADKDKQQDWHFCDELTYGDFVYTDNGWKKVLKCEKSKNKQYMYDISLDRLDIELDNNQDI